MIFRSPCKFLTFLAPVLFCFSVTKTIFFKKYFKSSELLTKVVAMPLDV